MVRAGRDPGGLAAPLPRPPCSPAGGCPASASCAPCRCPPCAVAPVRSPLTRNCAPPLRSVPRRRPVVWRGVAWCGAARRGTCVALGVVCCGVWCVRDVLWRLVCVRDVLWCGMQVGISASCILGYNVNAGQEISLRLRTDDLRGFRKYERVRETLLHELAHMEYGEHDVRFKELNSRLGREAEAVNARERLGTRVLSSLSPFGDDADAGPRRSELDDVLLQDDVMAATARMSGRTLRQLAAAGGGAAAAATARPAAPAGAAAPPPAAAPAGTGGSAPGSGSGSDGGGDGVAGDEYEHYDPATERAEDAMRRLGSQEQAAAPSRAGPGAEPMPSGSEPALQQHRPEAAAAVAAPAWEEAAQAAPSSAGGHSMDVDVQAPARAMEAGAGAGPEAARPAPGEAAAAAAGGSGGSSSGGAAGAAAPRARALVVQLDPPYAGGADAGGGGPPADDDPAGQKYRQAWGALSLLVGSVSADVAEAALHTLQTLLGNVAANPREPKYKQVRLGNGAFHRRVGCLPGGMDVLKAAGFVEEPAAASAAGALSPAGAAAPGVLQLRRDDPGLCWLVLSAVNDAMEQLRAKAEAAAAAQ